MEHWRLYLNGYLDQLAYEIGAVNRDVPFAELRARSRLGAQIATGEDSVEFSRRLRAGRP